jgi:Flp pilus assembly protein TadB
MKPHSRGERTSKRKALIATTAAIAAFIGFVWLLQPPLLFLFYVISIFAVL